MSGSSEVKVTVNRPVWTLKSRATCTFNERAVGVLVADGGLVLRQPGGDGDVDRAEAERAELEGGPVEVRIELLGDGDVLGGGAAVVLEVDGVRQDPVGEEVLGRTAGPMRALGSRGVTLGVDPDGPGFVGTGLGSGGLGHEAFWPILAR